MLPPSRTITLPFTNAPAALARNKITPAMSCSLPNLPAGKCPLLRIASLSVHFEANSDGKTNTVSTSTVDLGLRVAILDAL